MKILGYDDRKITFHDEGTGTMVLIQVRRHSNVRFSEFFYRHFGEQDPKAGDGAISALTKAEQVASRPGPSPRG